MNELMKVYNELKQSEGNAVAFTELENFLREFTKSLSCEEAFNLCRCLISQEEMRWLFDESK